ncbi:hypothetical protein CDAR_521901 [Caerostris darwini]|uniref:Uncharacterized protein n=1 Tax=Caerostris darwini TaxID=1538125 RepID=A0AAV4P1T1_9ARAC|nr:hypothetical protein CDAR_521901 [Caerostris darwini]
MRGGSGGLGTEAECSDFEALIPLGVATSRNTNPLLIPTHSYLSSYHPCSSASSDGGMDGWMEEECPDGIFYLVSTPSAGCAKEVEVLERKRNVRISKL